MAKSFGLLQAASCQNTNRLFESVFAGPINSKAVLNSPILGYGSWAKSFKYSEMLAELQYEWGTTNDPEGAEDAEEGLIPAHSHLMVAWVWAGILGAVFWCYVLWLVPKGIIALSFLQPSLTPLYTWLLVDFLWAIIFSPFGSTDRMTDTLRLVIIIDLLQFAPAIPKLSPFRWQRSRIQRVSFR